MLAIARRLEMNPLIDGATDYIAHNFSGNLMGLIIGYLLVMRTNMALDRWMEGIGEIQNMLARWRNAYSALNAFLAGKKGEPEVFYKLDNFRTRVAHWFALMSCIAIATLRAGTHLRLDHIPVRPKFGQAVRGRKKSLASCSQDDVGGHGFAKEILTVQAPGGVKILNLSVLHEPTSEEVTELEKSKDKVYTVFCWIMQAFMIEIREGRIDAPPPILTFVYSEMSNGMLGFHQALKVARVPFPFPFAQMVACALGMWLFCLPFYIDVFSHMVFMTTITCFILPVAYVGLNSISVELEAPFGVAENNVDIEERHEAFVCFIEDMLMLPMNPPRSENATIENAIIKGSGKWKVNTPAASST
jgi:predicted membrane chloride channel (bestrophin family)